MVTIYSGEVVTNLNLDGYGTRSKGGGLQN